VFFAVGFETAAPANTMAAYHAKREGMRNFSIPVSHVLVPPAMRSILDAPTNRIQGFLAAGHVCTVMGYAEYEPIAARYMCRSWSPASSRSISSKVFIFACASWRTAALPDLTEAG